MYSVHRSSSGSLNLGFEPRKKYPQSSPNSSFSSTGTADIRNRSNPGSLSRPTSAVGLNARQNVDVRKDFSPKREGLRPPSKFSEEELALVLNPRHGMEDVDFHSESAVYSYGHRWNRTENPHVQNFSPGLSAREIDVQDTYGPFRFVQAQDETLPLKRDFAIFEKHPKNFREVGVLYTALNRCFPGQNTLGKRSDVVMPIRLGAEVVLPSQAELNRTFRQWFLVRFPSKTETVTLSEKDYQETFRKLHAYLEKVDNRALRAMVLTAVDHLCAFETRQKGEHVFDFGAGASLRLPVLGGAKPVLSKTYGAVSGPGSSRLFQAMGKALLPHLTPRLDDADRTMVVALPRLSWRDFMAKPDQDIVQYRFFHDTMATLGDNAATRQALCEARLETSPTLGLQLFRELLQSPEARSSETAAVINGLNTAFFVQAGVARLDNMRTVLAANPEQKESLKHALSVLYAMWMQPDGPSVSEIHGQLNGGILSGCTVQTLDVLLRQFPRLFSEAQIVLPAFLGESPRMDMVQAYLDIAGGTLTDAQLNLLSTLEGDVPVYRALQSAEEARSACLASLSPDLVVPHISVLAKTFYDQIRSELRPGSMGAVFDRNSGLSISARDTHAEILTDLCVKWLRKPDYVPTLEESRCLDQNRHAFDMACRRAGVVHCDFDRPPKNEMLSLHSLREASQRHDSFPHKSFKWTNPPSAADDDGQSQFSFHWSDVGELVDVDPLNTHNQVVISQDPDEEKEDTPFFAGPYHRPLHSEMSQSLSHPQWSAQGGTSTGRNISIKKETLYFEDVVPRSLQQELLVEDVFDSLSRQAIAERTSPLDRLLQSFIAMPKPVLENIVDLKTRQREFFASGLALNPDLTAKSVAWILQLPTAPTYPENIEKAYVALYAIVHAEDSELKKAIAAELGISEEALVAKYETVRYARAVCEIANTDWASPLEHRLATQLLDFYHNNPAEKAVESGGQVNHKLTKASAELSLLYHAASDNPAAFEKMARVAFFSGDHDRFWRDMQRLQDNEQVRTRLVNCLLDNAIPKHLPEMRAQWQSFFSPTLPARLQLSPKCFQKFDAIKTGLSAPVQARVLRFQAMSAVISPATCALPSEPKAAAALSEPERKTFSTHRALLWQFSRSGATIFEDTSKESEKQQRALYRHTLISKLLTVTRPLGTLRAHLQINENACEALNTAFQTLQAHDQTRATGFFPLSWNLESPPESALDCFDATAKCMISLRLQHVALMKGNEKKITEILLNLASDANRNDAFLAFSDAVLNQTDAVLNQTKPVFQAYPQRTRDFVLWLIETAKADRRETGDGRCSLAFTAALRDFQKNIALFGDAADLDKILSEILGVTDYGVAPHHDLLYLLNSLSLRPSDGYPWGDTVEHKSNV